MTHNDGLFHIETGNITAPTMGKCVIVRHVRHALSHGRRPI
jgi:hypothetical protein